MRRTSLGLVVIALLLAGTAAHAEEDVEADNDIFHRDGGYFGLSGIAGVPVGDFGTSGAFGGGVNGRLGWHGTGWLSFEMQAEYIHGMATEETDTADGLVGRHQQEWRTFAFTTNFKASCPIDRKSVV